MESIAAARPSDFSVASAAFRTSDSETGSRTPSDEIEIALRRAGRPLLAGGVFGVGFYDLADEAVPDDVRIGEVVEADSLDSRKNPLDLDEA